LLKVSISHVLFDFDGTLSWLRHGWPEMMCDLFRPQLPVLGGETAAQIRELLLTDILSLNGKPSIHQMMRFCERVKARGGSCPSPEYLLNAYQSRLDAVIEERLRKNIKCSSDGRKGDGPSSLRFSTDEFVIFGARAFLEKLRERGLTLMILSGTLEHRVKEEAEWLGLSSFFGRHIYGSAPDHTQFSKRQVIERLLREEKIQGQHLLSFGDGPVEIAETKAVGGFAVAVASDENVNGSGKMDAIKQHILTDAGADAVIADYREADALMKQVGF